MGHSDTLYRMTLDPSVQFLDIHTLVPTPSDGDSYWYVTIVTAVEPAINMMNMHFTKKKKKLIMQHR